MDNLVGVVDVVIFFWQLHTLEDFSAHSNFCELALVRMGYKKVFTHVGRNVYVVPPGNKRRRVAPLVTG